MSLVYQSLQKLQAQNEGQGDSGPENGGPPPPGIRARGILLWGLLGVVLLAGGGYTAWTMAHGPAQGRSSPAKATRNESGTDRESQPTQGPNATQIVTGEANASKPPKATSETDPPPAGNRTRAAAGTSDPRLLRFSCRRNGTRARLGLEFDRQPDPPKTSWNNATKSLRLAFSAATVRNPGDLAKRAARRDLVLVPESSDPLRLRLTAPGLEEYSAFILPDSGEFGPRFVLSLRFSPQNRKDSVPCAQAQSARVADSGEESATPRAREHAAPEADPTPSQKSGAKEAASGSLDVAPSSGTHSSADRPRGGVDQARRLLEQNRDRGAIRLLRQRLRRASGDHEARLLLSRALTRQGDPERAVSVLRQGIRLAPGNLTLRTRCAKLLISQQHHRRALEALRLDNPPNVQDHVPYYALLAYTLRKLGESERSARIYRALAEHEPDRGKWWMGLGLCLERLDRNRPALSAYERALAAGLPEDIHAFITQRREVLASGQPE